MPGVLKWKLNLKITEIVSGMGEKLDRYHVGDEIYQATYILYQVKSVHTGMIYKLIDITAHPPADIGVNNLNEGILHEYGLGNFIPNTTLWGISLLE